MYTATHQPHKMSEIIGQEKGVSALVSFVKGYKAGKKKAALLYGPPGTGKTASVYALAHDLNLEIVEVNASDVRNHEQVQATIGAAAGQMSLFFRGKVILVDEIDGLSGAKDRGGLSAVLSVMESSAFPIVLTCANPWDTKFSSLRNKSEMIAFEPLSTKSIVSILSSITAKESIAIDEKSVKAIARSAGGDARAAIVDLQLAAALSGADFELGEREKEETIISALIKIFKTTDPSVAITAFDHVRENVDEQFLWLDENIPKEYEKPADLARAYNKLSRADVFSRRIRRWQHWRFLVYINALLTAGVAVAKDEKYRKMTEYKPTGRILKMWWAKQKAMKKKTIAEKIALATHSSTRQALQNIEFYKVMYAKNKSMAAALTFELQLTKEECEWLAK
ncbi:TPA: replication factor C large subunit [Candidatus Woesearchaeota archaeon]|nr:replication factor C large subunit [Candidatus Woesearchaeota archaeon]HII68986.1 replication factor C large subunit [Candidatus Woesearchaeota archaeon]